MLARVERLQRLQKAEAYLRGRFPQWDTMDNSIRYELVSEAEAAIRDRSAVGPAVTRRLNDMRRRGWIK